MDFTKVATLLRMRYARRYPKSWWSPSLLDIANRWIARRNTQMITRRFARKAWRQA